MGRGGEKKNLLQNTAADDSITMLGLIGENTTNFKPTKEKKRKKRTRYNRSFPLKCHDRLDCTPIKWERKKEETVAKSLL
jgi:hypothetical protein